MVDYGQKPVVDDNRQSTEVIELAGVNKVYNTGAVAVHALADIDLTISSGDYIAIMGPSGSGKSTLMHILGCLDLPTSGDYYFRDNEISEYTSDQLARIRSREVGFVFQSFNLLPRLSARENIELPLMYSKVPADEREEIVENMLRMVGLADRGSHTPNELSGGETQRIAIARALANSPAIVLADEPTGNLDSKTGIEIMDLLDELNDGGTTLILVTHDEAVAEHASIRVNLYDGRMV